MENQPPRQEPEQENTLVRLQLQVKIGNEWTGDTWIYFTKEQASKLLANMSQLFISSMATKILKPMMEAIGKALHGS